MAIPIDFEDIVGAGCWDSIRRGFAAVTCVWLGCASGVGGYHAAGLVEGLVTGVPVDWDYGFWPYVLGPLLLFASFFLPLAFPLVIACYFTFVRSDEGGGFRWWFGYAAAWGLLIVLRFTPWGSLTAWSILPYFLWAGWIGAIGFLAWLITIRERRRFAEHLMELEAENELRRQGLREEFGTAHADTEWATGKQHLWDKDPPK